MRKYLTPEKRVKQARLHLLSLAKIENENQYLKKTIGIPAITCAFIAGFITSFSPSLSKAISREIISHSRFWATNHRGH
ncbi:hypothetical protein [Nitrosococcus halophilus]|uniref:hypothetical protein n=1 Tax=Nitrosococcus halophilus TaxID=133539 RepID=UPI000A069A67|nr:hypothetical protein [Nitrosococcus halophilus]